MKGKKIRLLTGLSLAFVLVGIGMVISPGAHRASWKGGGKKEWKGSSMKSREGIVQQVALKRVIIA